MVAAYDPVTGNWQEITPNLPASHPARFVSVVAAPGRLILWSLWDQEHKTSVGYSDHAGVDVFALGQAGGWRDVTGDWPQNQLVTAPVLTGQGILVSPGQIWCGMGCSPPYTSFPGYFADPLTLRRSAIAAGPSGMANPAFVWTGQALIAVNLDFSGGRPVISQDDMAVWDPATGGWRPLAAPPGRPSLAATPVWAGDQLIALAKDGSMFTRRG